MISYGVRKLCYYIFIGKSALFLLLLLMYDNVVGGGRTLTKQHSDLLAIQCFSHLNPSRSIWMNRQWLADASRVSSNSTVIKKQVRSKTRKHIQRGTPVPWVGYGRSIYLRTHAHACRPLGSCPTGVKFTVSSRYPRRTVSPLFRVCCPFHAQDLKENV